MAPKEAGLRAGVAGASLSRARIRTQLSGCYYGRALTTAPHSLSTQG